MGTGDSRRLSEHFVEYYRSCYFSLSNLSHSIIMAGALKRFIPMFDRVLIERAEAMTRTRGGIVIPEKAQEKVVHGTVVAVGPGTRTKNGDLVPVAVTLGIKSCFPSTEAPKWSSKANSITYSARAIFWENLI